MESSYQPILNLNRRSEKSEKALKYHEKGSQTSDISRDFRTADILRF